MIANSLYPTEEVVLTCTFIPLPSLFTDWGYCSCITVHHTIKYGTYILISILKESIVLLYHTVIGSFFALQLFGSI